MFNKFTLYITDAWILFFKNVCCCISYALLRDKLSPKFSNLNINDKITSRGFSLGQEFVKGSIGGVTGL